MAAGVFLREADEELRRGRELLPCRPVQEHGAPEHRVDRGGHKAEAPGQQDGKTPGQRDARAGGRQSERRCHVVHRMRHMEVFLTAHIRRDVVDGLPADGDDVRFAHLLPGDGLPCQRVLGQREHVDRRFKKQLARHARFQITGRAVAEVGAAVHHGLLDPGHGQIHELDPHLRIPAHEAVGQQRDQRTAQKRRRRDAYPVDAGIVQFRGALLHAAEHVLGPAGLFEKYLARRRQFDDSPPSVKKLDAYLSSRSLTRLLTALCVMCSAAPAAVKLRSSATIKKAST